MACTPWKVTRADFEHFDHTLSASEKCHVAMLVAEARKQAQIAARREAERRAAEARKAGKPVPKAEPVKEAPVVDDVADDSAAGRAFFEE